MVGLNEKVFTLKNVAFTFAYSLTLYTPYSSVCVVGGDVCMGLYRNPEGALISNIEELHRSGRRRRQFSGVRHCRENNMEVHVEIQS